MDKNIYISFIRTNTAFGALVRRLTKWKYSHVNICLDSKLNNFYAFATRNHKSELSAAFNMDYKDNYTLAKNKPVNITYYKIPVKKEEYEHIKNFINEIANDDEYIFNLLSMVTTTVLHGFEIHKSYNCITFISKILTFIESIKLSKKYYKYDLNELENEIKEFYYKEEVYYYEGKEKDNKFFNSIPFFKRKIIEIIMLRENFYRLFHKKTSKLYKKFLSSNYNSFKK